MKRTEQKKILVTGGAGYKGVLLAEKLLERGHQVTIHDNFIYGFDPVMHLVSDKNLSIVKDDIRNISKKTIEGFDVIYHLAGIGGLPGCEANPFSAQSINADATIKLASLADPKQLIVYAGTTTVYGDQKGKACDETTPVILKSVYSKTKFAGEEAIMKRKNSIGFRFATIFGPSPRMRTDLIVNDFCYRAIYDRVLVLFQANSRRTCLHVDDAVQAYLLALDKSDEMKGNIYNVGSEGLNFTKLEIAERIAKASSCKVISSEIKDADTRDFTVSYAKLAKLGFKPQKTLDDGIAEMMKVYAFYDPFQDFKTI